MTPLRNPARDRHAARLTKACDNCRIRKRKCDGVQPCEPCQTRKVACVYRTRLDGRRRIALPALPTPTEAVETSTESIPTPVPSFGIVDSLGQTVPTSQLPVSAETAPCDTPRPRQPKHQNPGSLQFGLNIGENGELEYRGPTSSTIGLPLSTSPDRTYTSAAAPDVQAPIPSHEALGHYMELFLEWQNASIIIVASFQVDNLFRSATEPDVHPGTKILVLSIIALTSCFYQNITETSSDAYFQSAKHMLLQAAFSKPSIEVVQAACILACREYGCGHENAAWTLNGVAATVSSTIGLHVLGDAMRWVAIGHITESDVQIRSITYWATIVIDRILASCLGRHCLIHASDTTTPPIHIQLPTAETSSAGRSRILTFGTSEYENNVLATFRHSVEFWKLNDRALSDIYDFRHDMSNLDVDSPEREELFSSLQKMVPKHRTELFAWYDSLPASIKVSPTNRTPHALLFDMAYHNLVILMHRPFIEVGYSDNAPDHDSPEDTLARQSRTHSIASSAIITQHVRTLQAHYKFSCVPFPVTHYILTTATIHVVNVDNEDCNIARNAVQGLETCLVALQEISQCWPIAAKAIKTIRNLEEELQIQEGRTRACRISVNPSREQSPPISDPQVQESYGAVTADCGEAVTMDDGLANTIIDAVPARMSWESVVGPDSDDPIAKLLSSMPTLNYSEDLFWGSFYIN